MLLEITVTEYIWKMFWTQVKMEVVRNLFDMLLVNF